jgi:hypothetical protein
MPSLLDISRASVLPAGTDSNSILARLQQTYGAIKYDQQSVSRYPYYSYIPYPLAGASSLSWFGQNMATVSSLLTNIEQAGTLGNYSFMITSIGFDVMLYIPTVANNAPWSYTTELLAPYADIVHGLTQGGYATLEINNTAWDIAPLPFMTSPAAIGKNRMDIAAGMFDMSQSGTTPFAVTGAQTSLCNADIERRAWRRRNLTNPIFLAPQTTFNMSLNYDFGAIPVIAQSVITAGTFTVGTPCILVGVRWDGWRYAPLS